MSDFDNAFNYMIQYEGDKFVDNPDDKGGPTKFGISERFIHSLLDGKQLVPYYTGDGVIDWDSAIIPNYIQELDIVLAKLIYQKYFWLSIYEQIESQDICNFIFDMTVQHGKKKAAELTQRALNAAMDQQILKVDGIFGSDTLALIYRCQLTKIDESGLRSCLVAVRESLFRCIVAHNQSQQQFLEGWLKRAYGEKL